MVAMPEQDKFPTEGEASSVLEPRLFPDVLPTSHAQLGTRYNSTPVGHISWENRAVTVLYCAR